MIALRWRPLEGQSGHEAGRQLLAQMYEELVGGQMPPILRLPRGKPCFAQGNVHFSISHSKGHVFCALSDRPIGIDAEELDRKLDLRIADRILSASEKAQYDAAPDKRLALLTFWVLKEAAAKLSGEGINANPRHTAFSLDDPRVQMTEGCLVAVIE